jgi:hypothetical protein
VNPILAASLRRHWQLFGAVAAFLIFSAIHLTVFRPAAARYRAALHVASGVDPEPQSGAAPAMLPPRVFGLIAANSLPPQEAVDRGSSGALGVILLEDLDHVASRSGLTTMDSEPGPVTQEPLVAQIRAHLRLRGSYDAVAGFFSELARSDALTIVERFRITPAGDGRDILEVWLSRVYLKQAGTRR